MIIEPVDYVIGFRAEFLLILLYFSKPKRSYNVRKIYRHITLVCSLINLSIAMKRI